MNINEVYQLMDKFEGSTLSELSIEMEGVKLSVKKPGAGIEQASTFKGRENNAAAPQTVTPAPEAASKSSKAINAPLVGTFYRAAGPGEKPFVEVGQQVRKGDVVAIIEAMKLMNEITATEDGIVEEIVAEDGNLVEYNEILIRLS